MFSDVGLAGTAGTAKSFAVVETEVDVVLGTLFMGDGTEVATVVADTGFTPFSQGLGGDPMTGLTSKTASKTLLLSSKWNGSVKQFEVRRRTPVSHEVTG